MRFKKWIKRNTSSLKGKRVAISGSTGGLGRELCRLVAYLGGDIVTVDRNPEKSRALATEIKSEFPHTEITHIKCDMSDIEGVKEAIGELRSIEVDHIILNAGAYSIPRYITDQGYDNVFTINFIAPYYIAREMLPYISSRNGRIVAVGSIAHNYSRIDERDVDFSGRKQASLVYGNAKRFLTYGLFALNSKSLAIAHPGISFTGITNHYPRLIFALIKHPMKVIFMRPDKACLSIIKGLFADCEANEWIGPRIFDVWGLPKKKTLRTASQTEREDIGKICEEIYGKL